MMSENFELFAGCLGNGTTICNKAVTEHGDYKTVAHISDGGNIKLYVDESYIPPDAMEKIKAWAASDKGKFQKNFESLPEIEQYGRILDNLSLSRLVEAITDKEPLAEKLPKLREYYYTIA